MRRLWLMVCLVAALGLGIAACGGDDDTNGDADGADTAPAAGAADLDLDEDGVIAVGSDIPYQPFEFGREPDYEGFDVDIVNEIAERLGLEARFVKTPFDTIFRDLNQEKFDMVASAVTITDERKEEVAFSAPYFRSDQSLMVQEGSEIRSVEDLEGAVIGVQAGTTGAEYARNDVEGADTVRPYDLIDDAFNALAGGQVDAVINDFPVSKFAEQEKTGLEVVETIETDEFYGLVFRQESDALREAVDQQLAAMKEDGTYAEIFRKWFEDEPPGSVLEADEP